MQDDKLTKTVIVQAAITVLVLLGGMWMFMNVLIFESGHFTGQRSLTLVETVYLMAQILTTVGYGDIVPAYPRGQVVVGCYVLLSLFLIVDMISLISTAVIGRVEKYSMRLTEEAFEEVTMLEGSQTTSQKRPLIFGKQEVSYMSLFSSGGPLLFFVLAGVLFFHYYPGEGKTWLQAIYMSIVTLSTTGFGAFTAVTTGGQVFGAFWMIFGVAALVSFVGAFAELLMKLKENERHSAAIMRAEMEANIKKVKPPVEGKLNRDEFLRFAVLQLRIASEEQLKAIEKVFDRRPDPRRLRASPKPQS